jgi:hypothetical protein
VRVRPLIAGCGSLAFPDRLRRVLVQAGAQLRIFRPVRLFSLRRDRLRRMHR